MVSKRRKDNSYWRDRRKELLDPEALMQRRLRESAKFYIFCRTYCQISQSIDSYLSAYRLWMEILRRRNYDGRDWCARSLIYEFLKYLDQAGFLDSRFDGKRLLFRLDVETFASSFPKVAQYKA